MPHDKVPCSDWFWTKPTNPQGQPKHARDCNPPMGKCNAIKGKTVKKKDGTQERLPDHFNYTMTCACREKP